MRPLSLTTAYENHLAEHGFESDPAQTALVARLQTLLDGLVEIEGRRERGSWLSQLRHRWKNKRGRGSLVQGIYVWGDVGRGKTFLLNLFFRHLPLERKTRVHFHQFMREIHALRAEARGTREPLEKIARDLAGHTRLLYLDEFHVIDIGDAMILGELLKHLLNYGVVPAMTSNCPPQTLYHNGLQRQRFLPTIALIEEHLEVFELGARCDYRLQFLSKTSLYNTPADETAERVMAGNFRQLITDAAEEDVRLRVNGRDIPARRCAGGVVWFDFGAICGDARSAADYLEIAHCYETVLISDIPLFADQDDLARRFINMIDTFYDCRVRLIVSAADRPEQLYRQGRLAQEFRRTASRLAEMQSSGYITQVHE